MSFLATLRHNQPQTQHATVLCYLFEVDLVTKTLRMSFNITELQQGELFDPDKPYQLQREHLQHPPPFIHQEDIDPLTKLVESDSAWLNQMQGELAEKNLSAILPGLLKTNRCFIKSTQKNWRQLSMADPVTIELQWLRNNNASYCLTWCSDSFSQLLNLKPDAILPIAYNSTQAQFSLVQHQLSDEAFIELKLSKRYLTILDAAFFVQEKQTTWGKLNLPLPDVKAIEHITASITPTLFFDSVKNHNIPGSIESHVSLMFCYSSDNYASLIAFDADELALDYWNGHQVYRLIRDHKQERRYLEDLHPLMATFDTTKTPYCWTTTETTAWLDILTHTRELLEKKGFQFLFGKQFCHHYVVADNWQLTISDADNTKLQLQLSAEVEGKPLNVFELLTQLQSFNREQKLLTLPDGRLLLLPVNKISGIMQELGDLYKQQKGVFQLPQSQINRLDTLRQQLPESTQWQGAVQHLELANGLHQTPALLETMIDGVNAQLRPYQWLGVCWFQHLKQYNVNGLLADDMGLGKTLQTLTHLSLEKQQGDLSYPALIVAPTSLLHNWVSEIQQFTPHLRFKIIHGYKRQQFWGTLESYDIVITSYQLIVNDLEHWQRQKLSWIILDEAQIIKNSQTKASQAVRKIESDNRLCLSGTPVENHLGELWSLLDFLMPGTLGTQKEFRDLYQKPIEQYADQMRMSQLQHRIAPFILRRTKEHVAQDLPEKTQIYQYISMGEAQRAFYETQKDITQTHMEQQLTGVEHAGQQQILLLSALMKLRQVCCDPALLGEENIQSAKRQHCIEMVEELVAENHTILIFSQFTRMLDLLADDLHKLKIAYLKLTGKTQNRQKLVEQFQKGDTPVFLISLKAGGLGLNLTRADTVIHYDPWWNSAAEQQASDRAHRIGQNKPVFIYKLISDDSIEEKIAELQHHKAQLSQHINQQAQLTGEKFALKLEDLMTLWQQEIN